MDIDLKTLNSSEQYKLLMSSVLPRPIALVTSLDREGIVNAAPFSLFNIMAASPPTVVIGIDARAPGLQKDTARNIQQTGEFVVNMVNEPMAAQMNLCAASLSPELSELDHSGLTQAASIQVKPPRIAESPISLECKRLTALDIGNERTIIVGTILHYHIKDEYYDATKAYVLADQIGLIARMHGRGWYSRTTDLFELNRPDESRYK
jgi:flavin reductase (DIM6/NTAB) family NADH-FMN oxidoreductase RutF